MDYLIDSNIIIYSYLEEYNYLREIITSTSSCISEISRIEVLGYHGIRADEEKYLQALFKFVPLIFPTKEVFDNAIHIRRQHSLKLGDSLIASTALIEGLTLYTRNINDFKKVKGLNFINPID